jgi:phytoene synthase
MTPQEYCQDKAAQSGSSFYYSFLSLPDDKRNAIIAVYAFCREVDDIVDSTADPQIKYTKLQWWQEEINNLFNATPQHPISRALQPVVSSFNLPQEYFQEVLDGMLMDLEQTRYATFKELRLYCYRVASVVGLMSAEIFGYRDRQTLKYATDLGMAFQLTNIIRDVYDDISKNRIYIPMDELEKFGVSEQNLRNQIEDKKFLALMAYQAERAKTYYAKAFEQLPESDRFSQRTGIIMAEIYRTLLNEIIHDGFQVLTKRTSLPPLRKLWIAWKTKRRENKRHKRWLKAHGNSAQ